jgi:hypothetical protein
LSGWLMAAIYAIRIFGSCTRERLKRHERM